MTASLDTEAGISAYFVLFSALLALVLILSKYLHNRPRLASLLPEAGMILIVGVLCGALVNLLFIPDSSATTTTTTTGSSSQSTYDNQQQQQQQQYDYNNGVNDDAAAAASTTDDDTDEEVAESLLSFSNEVFFLFLLPPIIFNSGYHLRKELFFRHITPIILLAVIGTTVSAFAVAFFLELVKGLGWMEGRENFHPTFTELLTFGALISATDPVSTLAVFQVKRVDPQLFYLVFGESVLNDAVGLVLFNAFSKFVVKDNGAGKVAVDLGEFIVGFLYDSVCSPILGLGLGMAAAMVFKYVDMRDTKLLELCLYVLIMYVPFLLAEMLDLSGIVTILFTGMAARSYVMPNVSEETAHNANTLFRLAAHLAETSIFLELGLSVFGMKGSVYWTFILWSLVACLVGRALNVYPLVYVYNKYLCQQNEHESLDTNSYHGQDDHSHHHGSPPRGGGGAGISGSGSHAIEMSAISQSDSGSPTSRTSNGNQINTIEKNVNGPSASSPPPPAAASTSDDEPEINHFTGMVRHDLKISSNTAHMLWFSGLRGAVAYACVRSFPDTFHHDDEFTVTTMMIVLITVFGLGTTTEAALNGLGIEMNVDEDRYMEAWNREQSQDGLILQVEEVLQQYALRPEDTAMTLPTSDDHHHHSMAAGEASIASNFRHAADDQEDEHHQGGVGGAGGGGGGGMAVETHALDTSNRVRGRKRESVFDYGNK